MPKQDPGHLYETPLQVSTVGDAVVILGPDSVAISLSAEAARQSARLLEIAADEADRTMTGDSASSAGPRDNYPA